MEQTKFKFWNSVRLQIKYNNIIWIKKKAKQETTEAKIAIFNKTQMRVMFSV